MSFITKMPTITMFGKITCRTTSDELDLEAYFRENIADFIPRTFFLLELSLDETSVNVGDDPVNVKATVTYYPIERFKEGRTRRRRYFHSEEGMQVETLEYMVSSKKGLFGRYNKFIMERQ